MAKQKEARSLQILYDFSLCAKCPFMQIQRNVNPHGLNKLNFTDKAVEVKKTTYAFLGLKTSNEITQSTDSSTLQSYNS